jgi:hypothetical protein
MEKKWYQSAFRRNVVDMHLTEDDPRFLSEFDSKKYVDCLALAGVDSAVIYAHSHVGLCNYPTKVGRMHAGLKGRDILKEMIEGCHQKGIGVVVYYSLIFNTWAYRTFPDWQMRDQEGKGVADQGRYGICCPNSPYRDHMTAQVEELCRNYDFEGIRFDMTFWPNLVCYCPHCRQRFTRETGLEIPTLINWENPDWVTFQRKREAWLVEFAALATSTVRRLKPAASVEHQSAGNLCDWTFGVPLELRDQNDFLQGDFYGGTAQGSLVCKLLYNLSPNLPYGYETSICMDLADHTTLKPSELLEAKACRAIANGGAFIFIDAIDPVGTLDPKRYRRMGEIFKKTKVFDQYLGGTLGQDVGLYLGAESKFDPADNGKKTNQFSNRTPHLDATLSVTQSFVTHNIPFGVITRKNLDHLSRHRVLVLPNVLMMCDEEVAAIRKYVQNGGNLYVSKHTSLLRSDGRRQKDFMLADVLGVSWKGETKEGITYIAPAKAGKKILAGYDETYPLCLKETQLTVRAAESAVILGRLTRPYTDPADYTRFAAIHSNPPGVPTEYPSLVLNKFGKGKVIYSAAALENQDYHRPIFINLIRLLAGDNFSFESNAPAPVELTLFHQSDKHRDILHILNFQNEMPNLPVENITIKIRRTGKKVKKIAIRPEGKVLKHRIEGKYIIFTLPRLETFSLIELIYE